MKGSIVLLSCVVFSVSFVYVVDGSSLLPIKMFNPSKLHDAWEEFEKGKISTENVDSHPEGSSSLGKSHFPQNPGSHKDEYSTEDKVKVLMTEMTTHKTRKGMTNHFKFTHFNDVPQIVASFVNYFAKKWLKGDVGEGLTRKGQSIQNQFSKLKKDKRSFEKGVRNILIQNYNEIRNTLNTDKDTVPTWDETNPNETLLQEEYSDKSELTSTFKDQWQKKFMSTWQEISTNLVEASTEVLVKHILKPENPSDPLLNVDGQLEAHKGWFSTAAVLEPFALGLTYCYVYGSYYFKYEKGVSDYQAYIDKTTTSRRPDLYLGPPKKPLLEYVKAELTENPENKSVK